MSSEDRAPGGRARRERRATPLPAESSAGQTVAGMFAVLGHLVANRPRPVTEISEKHRDPWASADGHTVEGLDEPIERPEPPDRSGARL